MCLCQPLKGGLEMQPQRWLSERSGLNNLPFEIWSDSFVMGASILFGTSYYLASIGLFDYFLARGTVIRQNDRVAVL